MVIHPVAPVGRLRTGDPSGSALQTRWVEETSERSAAMVRAGVFTGEAPSTDLHCRGIAVPGGSWPIGVVFVLRRVSCHPDDPHVVRYQQV